MESYKVFFCFLCPFPPYQTLWKCILSTILCLASNNLCWKQQSSYTHLMLPVISNDWLGVDIYRGDNKQSCTYKFFSFSPTNDWLCKSLQAVKNSRVFWLSSSFSLSSIALKNVANKSFAKYFHCQLMQGFIQDFFSRGGGGGNCVWGKVDQ